MGYHSRLRYLLDNQADAAKYKAWKDLDSGQRQTKYAAATAQGGARVPVNRTSGFLIPMGASSNAKIAGVYPIFAQNAGHAIATALKSAIQPKYQKLTLPSGFVSSNPQGRKKPAIIRWTERDATVSSRTSRILDKGYKARKSDSASGGVGKDDETQAVAGSPAAFTEMLETENSKWVNAGDFRTAKLIPELDFIL